MKNGKDVLREVQLRMWKIAEFKETFTSLVISELHFEDKMEAFLAPFTRDLLMTRELVELGHDILMFAIHLCFYLHLAGTSLEVIHPTIGDKVDRSLCDLCNEDNEPIVKGVGKQKIKWILRPGFVNYEEGLDDVPKKATYKAQVIV